MKSTKFYQQTERKGHQIDATDQVIGRLATQVAVLLHGKNKSQYTPNADLGDKVSVTNVSKMKISGGKRGKKIYYRYSGYPGGMKEIKLAEVMEKNPSDALRQAVWRMLPKNRLRNGMMKRLVISK